MYRGSSRSLVRLSLILAFDLLLLELMHYVTAARAFSNFSNRRILGIIYPIILTIHYIVHSIATILEKQTILRSTASLNHPRGT